MTSEKRKLQSKLQSKVRMCEDEELTALDYDIMARLTSIRTIKEE